MNIQQAIKAVIAKQDLTENEMHAVMSDIMTGKTSQIPKITVWAKRIMYIAITQLFWVGADNNQGALVELA